MLNRSGGKSLLIVGSLSIGVIIASLAIYCLVVIHIITIDSRYNHRGKFLFSDELPASKPVLTRPKIPPQEHLSRLHKLVEKDELGLLMLETESGKKRVLWTDDKLEKWLPNEHPVFTISFSPSEDPPKQQLSKLTCKDAAGTSFRIYITGPNFQLNDWKDLLAKELECTSLIQEPSE